MNIPSKVRFVSDTFLAKTEEVFCRGVGPTKRVVVEGKTFLSNSTNFWYSGKNAIDETYLVRHQNDWVPA